MTLTATQTGKSGNGAPNFFPHINFCATLEIQNFSRQQKIAVVNSSFSVSHRQFSVSRRQNSLCFKFQALNVSKIHLGI